MLKIRLVTYILPKYVKTLQQFHKYTRFYTDGLEGKNKAGNAFIITNNSFSFSTYKNAIITQYLSAPYFSSNISTKFIIYTKINFY